MNINRYKIWCETDSKWEYTLREDDQPAPTACPTDTTHDVDAESIAIEKVIDTSVTEVITQYEKDDKILKIARGKGEVDETGKAVVLIKVPGDFGVKSRYISYGMAWFNEKHPDDSVKVQLVDHENVLGYGVDFVVSSYTDTDVEEDQQGWYIPYHSGVVEAEALGGYGEIPGGFWLMIEGRKGGESPSGTLYVNLSWGKKS